ncbi:hypothetical protein SALBM217S_08388 [Streptomyces griseoloalbus]
MGPHAPDATCLLTRPIAARCVHRRVVETFRRDGARHGRAVPPAPVGRRHRGHPVIRYRVTEAAAASTTLVTSWGCETLTACDARTSRTRAPARSAM